MLLFLGGRDGGLPSRAGVRGSSGVDWKLAGGCSSSCDFIFVLLRICIYGVVSQVDGPQNLI